MKKYGVTIASLILAGYLGISLFKDQPINQIPNEIVKPKITCHKKIKKIKKSRIKPSFVDNVNEIVKEDQIKYIVNETDLIKDLEYDFEVCDVEQALNKYVKAWLKTRKYHTNNYPFGYSKPWGSIHTYFINNFISCHNDNAISDYDNPEVFINTILDNNGAYNDAAHFFLENMAYFFKFKSDNFQNGKIVSSYLMNLLYKVNDPRIKLALSGKVYELEKNNETSRYLLESILENKKYQKYNSEEIIKGHLVYHELKDLSKNLSIIDIDEILQSEISDFSHENPYNLVRLVKLKRNLIQFKLNKEQTLNNHLDLNNIFYESLLTLNNILEDEHYSTNYDMKFIIDEIKTHENLLRKISN